MNSQHIMMCIEILFDKMCTREQESSQNTNGGKIIMKNKKVLSLLLAASIMATTLLTGCGNNSPEVNEEKPTVNASETTLGNEETGTTEFDPKAITEGVTLTIAVKSIDRITDMNTNWQTVQVEEALGVNLEFVQYPSADYSSKINLLIGSGEKLPDIIIGNKAADIQAWQAEGIFIPLDEYYDNPDYAKNINIASEDTGVDIRNSLTTADGSIYALPKFGQSVNGESQARLWIYTPWLEAVGKEMPTTTEEFYEVCKLVCESDLNGNGKADEIALTGSKLDHWFAPMMNPFQFTGNAEYVVVEDGKVNFAYVTDGWKEGLKYIRRFFEEGLIPKETLTQTFDQKNALVNNSGENQVSLIYPYWNPSSSVGLQWRLDHDCLMPLIGPEGEQYSYYVPALPTAGAGITVDCENPAAAFLVCDYLCSEEMGIAARWGERGVDWDYIEDAQPARMNGSTIEDYAPTVPGADMTFIAYNDSAFWSGKDPQNASWRQNSPYVWSERLYAGIATKAKNLTEEERLEYEISNEMQETIKALQGYFPDEVFDICPLTVEEEESITDAKTILSTYIQEAIGNFLIGNWDINEYWDTYIAELEKIGYKDVLEVYQTGYDRVH